MSTHSFTVQNVGPKFCLIQSITHASTMHKITLPQDTNEKWKIWEKNRTNKKIAKHIFKRNGTRPCIVHWGSVYNLEIFFWHVDALNNYKPKHERVFPTNIYLKHVNKQFIYHIFKKTNLHTINFLSEVKIINIVWNTNNFSCLQCHSNFFLSLFLYQYVMHCFHRSRQNKTANIGNRSHLEMSFIAADSLSVYVCIFSFK